MPETTPRKAIHLSVDERKARGKQQRETVPLAAHADVPFPSDRDPVGLLESQAVTRVPELVPIRYGRMLESPFAFLRGAALPMAADLAGTATTALNVQLCGDAHLSNFGVFASPDRRLVFDINDFDETHPGPFEWDVKRLAASIEVAGRENGHTPKQRRASALSAVEAYRTNMRTLAGEQNLQVWYRRLEIEEEVRANWEGLRASARSRLAANAAKARSRDSMQALRKLTRDVDGTPQFLSEPPLLVPIRELLPDADAATFTEGMRRIIRLYRQSLQSDRRHLVEQFRLVDFARKVVGVGSVGTRAWALLFLGRDSLDPLMLQAKEAQPSVLAPYVGVKGAYKNQGERVVAGQHLMQASSDIFLGSVRTKGLDGVDRDFYVRQLRDWKLSAAIELFEPTTMQVYGRLCGLTLARAHARSGDRIAIAAYLGSTDKFDRAIADFAVTYADQNERDHLALATAADEGRVNVQRGV